MESNKLPLISFVCPVFGDWETVESAVESIVDQDYPNIEIILSVDGCERSEGTVRKIVRKYQGNKRSVQGLYSVKNRGACIARNEGAKLAKGDYLSFLPADAKLLPGAVRIWMNHLTEHPDYDFLYGGYRFLDQLEDESTIKKWAKEANLDLKQYLEQTGFKKRFDGKYLVQQGYDYLSQPFDPYFLETANYIDGSFPLKTETFWKAGGWDAAIKSLQDWDLWLSVIKKAKGKGLFVRDVYFETAFPHKGGLSDDSNRNWLARTDQIKKKHGIQPRKICVASLGAPFHGRRIARLLDADFSEMPSFKPHRYEMVYLLGFFPSLADICGQVFRNCRGKKVIHWIGTDIWQMQQMDLYHRRVLLDFFAKNVDIHLAECDYTQKELAELGIDAKVVPLPPLEFFDASPLPKKFTVAVYQPYNNKNFYLPDICRKVADLCPEFDFKFFGDDMEIGKVNNIEYVGYVRDMKKLIDESSAIMRLTIHDGLPINVMEFICAGRNALVNLPIKHAMQVRSADPVIIAQALKRLAKAKLNKVGADYWRSKLSHKKFKKDINDLLAYKPEEYWENRAESWSQLADQGYSLPNEDARIINKWIKDLDFKSVIDLGCGNGRFVNEFEGKEYLGIDISKKLIKIAEERYPNKKFQVLKIENLVKLGNKKYDLLFSYTALEHIKNEDWAQAIEAMKKVGRHLLLIEPTDFESVGYCHCHDYAKDLHVIKKKKLSDKWMYLVDLNK